MCHVQGNFGNQREQWGISGDGFNLEFCHPLFACTALLISPGYRASLVQKGQGQGYCFLSRVVPAISIFCIFSEK
jgi:hypothetical protein